MGGAIYAERLRGMISGEVKLRWLALTSSGMSTLSSKSASSSVSLMVTKSSAGPWEVAEGSMAVDDAVWKLGEVVSLAALIGEVGVDMM